MKKVYFLIMFVFTFLLVGCNKEINVPTKVETKEETIIETETKKEKTPTVIETKGFDFDIVKEYIKLPIEIDDDIKLENKIEIDGKIINISYKMDNDALDSNGIINPSKEEDEIVTVTGVFSYEDETKELEIGKITVLSMKKIVEKAVEQVVIPEEVDQNIELITQIGKVKLSWYSDDDGALTEEGVCKYQTKDCPVILSCTYLYKTDKDFYKLEKDYSLTVKPWNPLFRYESVINSVRIPTITDNNINLPISLKYQVSCSWSTSDKSVCDTCGNISRWDTDKDVILTLTLSCKGYDVTKDYDFQVTILKSDAAEGEMEFKKHILVERARDFDTNKMTNLVYDETIQRVVLKDDALSGTYESKIINTKDFYRIVGSFSCITSPKATAELEYSIKVDGTWSKYLSYGKFGIGRTNIYYNQTDTNAMIDTDMVIPLNNKVGTAFKYRITLRRDSLTDESPKLSLIGSCIFMNNYTYKVDTSKLPNSVDWDVPKLNQNIVPRIGNVICSATTTTMLLKYAGYDFSDKGYKYEHEYMANIVADTGHNNPTYGNWSYNMMGAGGFGANCYVGKYYSWDEIRYHLANYGPLGVSIGGNFGAYTTAGHLLVLRGYRIENGQTIVICNDPNIDVVYYEVSLQTFLECWGSVVYIMEFNNQEIINLR